MSEIAILGYGAIAAAFLATTVTGIAAVVGAVSHNPRFQKTAEYGTYLTCTFFGVAAAAMLHAFIHQDYSLIYVYQYSDANMPWYYQLAAFWGGQAGSLLFWAVAQSIFMAAAVVLHRKRDAALMPWFIAVSASVLLFFTTLLLFVSNPFETYMVIDPPADGQGLNPQLQTMTMVIHPPSLLLGYVAAIIPFSFAMAALLTGRLGDEWAKATRKWAIICWAFLSVGLILGMLWAYTELGWGGYWAWDPVENAAFIPWLVLTAFLHSVIIQEKRGMLKRWNMFLILTTWLLTIFGTFLTRSGLISSVHSFAKSEIGDYFIFFMLTAGAAVYAVFAWRWKALKTDKGIESFLSREFTFLFNNWVLLAAAGVVIYGTIWPKLSEMLFDRTVSMGPPWFNRFMIPIGLLLIILMSVGTVISWRRASAKNFRRNFVKPLIFAGLLTGIVPPLYLMWRLEPMGVTPDTTDAVYALIAVFSCAFSIGTTFQEFWRGTRSRRNKLGVGVLTALTGLVMRNQRRYGGYIVHIGMTMLIFGFVGEAFRVDAEVVMHVGQVTPLGDYEVRLTGVREEQDPEKVKMFADVDLVKDGVVISQLSPGRFFFHAAQSGTSEVDIRSTPSEDVFFAVINYDIESQTAALLMVINPFVWWIWVGGIFLIFGTMVCMWPELEPATAKVRLQRPAAATVAGVLALLAIPLSLAVMETSAHAQDESAAVDADNIEMHDPATREILDLIKCECPSCNGFSIARCHPGCGHGKRDRDRVVTLLGEGMSRDDVLAVFVADRGEEALLQPKAEGINHLTWLLPLLGAGLAVPVIVLFARKRKDDGQSLDEAVAQKNEGELSDEEQTRLDELERTLDNME